jgi:hypothetical protein
LIGKDRERRSSLFESGNMWPGSKRCRPVEKCYFTLSAQRRRSFWVLVFVATDPHARRATQLLLAGKFHQPGFKACLAEKPHRMEHEEGAPGRPQSLEKPLWAKRAAGPRRPARLCGAVSRVSLDSYSALLGRDGASFEVTG